MTSTVRIVSGSYRKAPINNQVFTLVKGYQLGAKGGFVTVKNEGQFPGRSDELRIQVDNQQQLEFLNQAGLDQLKVETAQESETEQQAMDRIGARFDVLDEMSRACIAGDIRAMIVSGPPGVGKSHGVTQQMEKASMFDKI